MGNQYSKSRPNVVCLKCGKKKARRIQRQTPFNKIFTGLAFIGIFGVFVLSIIGDELDVPGYFSTVAFLLFIIPLLIPTIIDNIKGEGTFRCKSCNKTYVTEREGYSAGAKLFWISFVVIGLGAISSAFVYKLLATYFL